MARNTLASCFLPCPVCEGSGSEPKWFSLEEFAVTLRQVQCPHVHTAFRGGYPFNSMEIFTPIQGITWDEEKYHRPVVTWLYKGLVEP